MPIQQRRGVGTGSPTAGLPITSNGVQSGSSRSRNHRRPKIVSLYARHSPIRWVILIVISMALASLLWKPVVLFFGVQKKIAPGHNFNLSRKVKQNPDASGTNGRSDLPLSKFSELSFALRNSDLVALYFAASWCPMSTPVSVALDKSFGNKGVLLTPNGGRNTLAVVYVSSDKTLDEYDGYLHNRDWLAVPFDSPQRSELKRHFSTCAHRELEELGIDRKHEIPTIIVIDSKTHGIITTNGADDVDKMGDGALKHWKDMQTWIKKTAGSMT